MGRKLKLGVLVAFFVLMLSACTYAGTYRLTVNKGTNCVTVYEKQGNNYVPIKAMICSVGANDGTPSGVFNTCAKYTWRPLFGNVYGQYATRINGNILFHSVYYKKTDPSSLKTVEYNKLGQAVSMGCVRLTTADAKWIYDNCSLGTQVTIVNNGTDPLGRPKSIYLGKNASYPNWDPTDPNVNNPWHKEGVKFLANYSSLHKTINASDNLTSQQLAEKIREGVTAYDTANNVHILPRLRFLPVLLLASEPACVCVQTFCPDQMQAYPRNFFSLHVHVLHVLFQKEYYRNAALLRKVPV